MYIYIYIYSIIALLGYHTTEEKENKKWVEKSIERYDVTAEIFVILSKMATKS